MKNIRRGKYANVNNSIKQLYIAVSLWIVFVLCQGCEGTSPNVPSSNNVGTNDTGFVAAMPGNYDSMDTAVVIKKDLTNCTIQFKTLAIGKYYTLNYDGATGYYDKYGTPLSLAQVREGDIVDVCFLKSRKRLDSLSVNSEAFSFSSVDNFEFLGDGKTVMISTEQYTLDKDVSVIGVNGECELMDINRVDTLAFIGFDHNICSIIVEQGHGYLRLTNEAYFVGGWLEVNHKYIYQIEDEMLVPVPAGTYPVSVSAYGSEGSENITVEPGDEYELDVGKWQAQTKQGSIIFTVSPDDAIIYIDGTKVDISSAVELDYGIHQMLVICDGYNTITKYIKVNSDSANINVTMEKSSTAAGQNVSDNVSSISDNSVSGNLPGISTGNVSISANQIAGNSDNNSNTDYVVIKPDTISTDSSAKVYISSPENVEVYLDGTYVGITPLSFNKPSGQAVITLRCTGYQTRSYSLVFGDNNEDESYSFSQLVSLSGEN